MKAAVTYSPLDAANPAVIICENTTPRQRGKVARMHPYLRMALIVVGIALLLPGLCGTLFLGATGVDSLSRWAAGRGSDPYGIIVVIVAGVSIQIGCLGMAILARMTPKPGMVTASRIAGGIGLVSALIMAAYFIADASATDYGDPSGVLLAAAMVVVPFVAGGLPALLAKAQP